MQNKTIITIGSGRFSRDLASKISHRSLYEIVNVSEEEKEGVSKEPNKIINEVNAIVSERNITPVAFVSFGRNTVLESVENIAKTLDELKKSKKFRDCVFIGPSFNTAKIFSNKWNTVKFLSKDKFSIPNTVKLTDVNISKIRHKLESKVFPLPSLIKATYLTGGIGMRLIESSKELEDAYVLQKKQGIKESILTEYLSGPEVMVQLLYLGDNILPFPMTIAEPTRKSLEHGDNKIKICGYVKPIPTIYDEAIHIAKKYKTHGYFAIEGIVYDLHKRRWKIMEGMTRFTGSYPMPNATYPNFDCLKAIIYYLQGRKWYVRTNKHQEVVLQVPIFKNDVNIAKNAVDHLQDANWIIQARVDDLSQLPCSIDKRVRVQMTIKCGEGFGLQKRCRYLEKIFDDNTIESRIKNAFLQIDSFFPDLLIKDDLFQWKG